jgi:hypothetical protein
VDRLPPHTVITGVQRHGSRLVVRGTTSDDGAVTRVVVNGAAAQPGAGGEWQVALDGIAAGPLTLTAHAEDDAGNIEVTRHVMTVIVR